MGGQLCCARRSQAEGQDGKSGGKTNMAASLTPGTHEVNQVKHVTTNVCNNYNNVILCAKDNQNGVLQSTNEIHPNHSNVLTSSHGGVMTSTQDENWEDQSSHVYQNFVETGRQASGGVAGDDVYAKVTKPKAATKPEQPKVPPPKPKLQLKMKQPTSQGQELNYIEVEFTSSYPPARKAEPATNYSDVVHEGGRLLLMN